MSARHYTLWHYHWFSHSALSPAAVSLCEASCSLAWEVQPRPCQGPMPGLSICTGSSLASDLTNSNYFSSLNCNLCLICLLCFGSVFLCHNIGMYPWQKNQGNCGTYLTLPFSYELQSYASYCSLPPIFCSLLEFISVERQDRYQLFCHCGTLKSLNTSS